MARKSKSAKTLGRHSANKGLHIGMKHPKTKVSKKKYHKGKAY